MKKPENPQVLRQTLLSYILTELPAELLVLVRNVKLKVSRRKF